MPSKTSKKKNSNNKKENFQITIQNDHVKGPKDSNFKNPAQKQIHSPAISSPLSTPIMQEIEKPVIVEVVEKNTVQEQVVVIPLEISQTFSPPNEEPSNELDNSTTSNDGDNSDDNEVVVTPRKYVLVFDDPINYNTKHPLKNKWTFWFDKPSPVQRKTWGDHLEKIYTFEFIEDFWRLYNNIHPVSRLASQSNYHLFKEGIVPKWEDPMNENGGRWMFNVEKYNNPRKLIDTYFLKAMLACIGELITTNDDEVCGVVASVKNKEDRISLWCYSTPQENSITRRCGLQFRKLLDIPEDCKLYFQSSKDGISGSRAALDYVV